METTYYAYPTHEFFITLGRLWFERLDDELWKFAQGLSEWLYHLDANPTPHWRQGLDRFLAEQRAEGREPTPESRAELEAFLANWASEAFPDDPSAVRLRARERVHGALLLELDDKLAQLPRRSGRTTPRTQFLDKQPFAIFHRKLQEADLYLRELEQAISPLARKLDAARLDEPVEVDDDLDRIEKLIWLHNDAVEKAREAWLDGNLGSEAYDKLMLVSSPASVGLPLFVNQDQAERAKEQWKRIGKRLNQRIAFLDNVILSMQVMEAAGQVASFAVGGVLIFNAVQVGGKIVLVKTAAKVAAGYAVSRVAGEAVHAGLRAAGVSEETIEHIQTAVEIVAWLLILRRIGKSLPTSASTRPSSQSIQPSVRSPERKPTPALGKNPYKNQSGDPEIAARKARTYPHGQRTGQHSRKKTHPRIEGRLDKPRSAHHQFLQRTIAEEMQASGDYTKVTMRMKLSKVSGVKHQPDIEPDNIGVDHDGKIHIIEILSPRQSLKQLQKKLEHAMSELPLEKRGITRITDPQDAFK